MYQRLSKLNTPSELSPKTPSSPIGGGKGKKISVTNAASFDGSVHLEMMPKPNRAYIQTSIETAVTRMQNVIELGRVLRDRKTMPIKYPVPSVTVIHKNEQYLKDIQALESFVLGELNARQLITCADKARYGVKMRAEPDHKTLGLRLKGDFKAVMAAIKQLTDDQIQVSLDKGYFEILKHRIELEEVRIIYAMDENTDSKYEAHSDNDVLVLMDLTPTEDLLFEGVAREIINRIQKLKKKLQLIPTDPVVVYYEISDKNSDLSKVAKSHQQFIEGVIKSPFLPLDATKIASETATRSVASEECDIKGVTLNITISMEKKAANAAAAAATKSTAGSATAQKPVARWLNVVSKIPPRYCSSGATNLGTVLIDDPNKKPLALQQLRNEIEQLFGLYHMNLFFTCNGKPLDLSSPIDTADKLNGETVFVSKQPGYTETDKKLLATAKVPFVKFSNVTVDGLPRTLLLENPKGELL